MEEILKYLIYVFPIPQDILDVKKGDVEIGMVSMDSYTESQYKKYYDHPLCNPEQKVAYAKALYRIDSHNKDGEGLKADHLKELRVFASDNTDQAFINWLCNNSPKISQVKTEIVRGAKFEEVCELYKAYTEDNKEIFRTEPAITCDSREYQRKIRDKAIELFQISRKTEILIYLSTRAGKSLVSLEIAKRINEKLPREKRSILIITAYPNAEDSFRKIAMYSQAFKGCDYINVKKDGWTKVKKNRREIIFCSYQMTIGDTTNGEPTVKKEFLEMVKDNHFGTIIFDETHTATDSKRFCDVLMPCLENHFSHIIHLSGTPFNDILSGRFSPDQIITYDFIDFLNWCHKNPGIIKIPNMYIHNVVLKPLYNQIKQKIKDEKLFDLINKFKWDIIFKDKDYCRSAINYIFGKSPIRLPGQKPNWFDTNQYKKAIMYVPPKTVDVVCESFDAIKDGKNKYVILNGTKYRLVKLSGKNPEKSDEKTVNKYLDEEEHVLIVTCRKEIVGVTLPRLDTLLMFSNTDSAELFIQMIFRLMTEYEGKDNVHVFCFNPNTSLNAFQKFAELKVNQRKDDGMLYTFNDVYTALLGAVNLDMMNLDTFDVSKIETPEVFLKEIKNLYRTRDPSTVCSNMSGILKMDFDLKVDGDLIKQSKKQIVDNGEKEETTEANREELKREVESKKQMIQEERKRLEEKSKSGNATLEEKSRLEKLIEDEKECEERKKIIKEENEKLRKIRIATKNLDKIIYVNDVNTWKDLVPVMNGMFKTTNPNFWEKFLGDNQRVLDDYICTIRQDERDGKINPYYFSKSSSDDISCPVEILNKFYEILKDGDYKTALDPTAGMGAMLMFAHEKFGIPKELCFGVEKDHLNYLICQRLGFVNVIEGDFMKENVQKELNINIEKNTKNMYRGVLFENKNMKIDLLIGNPPWDTKTDVHVEIIKAAKDIFNTAAVLMPDNFLKTNSNGRHERFRPYLEKSFKEISHSLNNEEKNLFNISYSGTVGIIVFNNTVVSNNYDDYMGEYNKLVEQSNKLVERSNKLVERLKMDDMFMSNKFYLRETYNGGYFIPIGTHGSVVSTELGLIKDDNTIILRDGEEKTLDVKKELFDMKNKKRNGEGYGVRINSIESGLRLLNFYNSSYIKDLNIALKAGCGNNFRHNMDFIIIEPVSLENLMSHENWEIVKTLASDAKKYVDDVKNNIE